MLGDRDLSSHDPPLTWDGIVRLRGEPLESLSLMYGGQVLSGSAVRPERIVPVRAAGCGDLAPLLARRWLSAAREAAGRGASILVEGSLAHAVTGLQAVWAHDHAAWAVAELLDDAIVPDTSVVMHETSTVAPTAVLGPRVVIGARVTIGPGSVIGYPGFGWAVGPQGAVRAVPQLGGVLVEDDVAIGPLCTIDAGTLSPTRIRRGAKLDAHVHVGHNGDVGEGAIVAAQCGFAGSVTIGRGARVGGQVGIADHVSVGDGARIAAKSGVIADVPPGATVAGYPAVARGLWLRTFAKLYRRR